ncbi:MAG TPA: nucleotide exchange factor GrpE [bacterium]|nr:nucleotide exchange factor GrpE [bacterium]
MKKEKKKKPTPDGAPVVELDEATAPKGLSLQEMADALGAQMEQAREEEPATAERPDTQAAEKKESAKPTPAPLADEETQKKLRELEETVKQLVAENRNQKTRLENDFRTKLKYAGEGFFREFLLVKDDLEKALTFAPQESDEKTTAFVDGVRHLNSAIDAVLKRHGIEPFGAVGETFDPNLHQAMRMADVAGKPLNEITTQYLKGWRYQDRVLRPAMVEVASGNAPADAERPAEEAPAPLNEVKESTNDTEGSNG